MALELKHTVAEVPASDIDLAAIIVHDCTGVYSTPANEGGWGSPNAAISEVSAVHIKFTDPNGKETTITPLVSATSTATLENFVLPNTDSVGHKVTADMLGATDIISGIWKIEYSVTIGSGDFAGETYCRITYFLMKQKTLCCLDKQVLDFKPAIPLSDHDRMIFDLRAMLCVADINAGLGQQEKAEEIMGYLSLQSECVC